MSGLLKSGGMQTMTPGPYQILLILLIVLIIFGAGKLPRVMGDLARGIKNFKHGLKDEEDKPKKIDRRKKADAESDL